MNVLSGCILSYSLHRLSFFSVVFDFNTSLNDVAPVSSMLLPVAKGKKNDLLMNVFECFFVSTIQNNFSECSV